MANEVEVYSFEDNFITALKKIISVVGVQAIAFGEDCVQETPRVEVNFNYGGANEVDRGIVPGTGVQYLQKHEGEIVLMVSSRDGASHPKLVGKIRNFMMWNAPTLIQPELAYYQVQSVFEQAGNNTRNPTEEDFELMSEMRFNVVFHIPPSSFVSA